MRNLLNIIILFLTLTACREIKVDKTNLLASDYRLFQDTPAWDLAKAADDNNVRKIRKIIKKNPSLINYQEPIHGKTILMQACYHHDYDSFEQLLKLGANVNLYDKVHGASAIIIVCRYNAGAKYVQKLLEYGANPNDLEVGERRKGNSTRYTPLRGAAAKGDLESVKLLLQAGAEVNFYDEFGSCALGEAIIQNHYDVVLLLLQHGAWFLEPIGKYVTNEPMCPLEIMRTDIYPLGSKEHQEKMEVVKLLKEQGIDYFQQPIEDYILKRIIKQYPNSWQEYIEKY